MSSQRFQARGWILCWAQAEKTISFSVSKLERSSEETNLSPHFAPGLHVSPHPSWILWHVYCLTSSSLQSVVFLSILVEFSPFFVLGCWCKHFLIKSGQAPIIGSKICVFRPCSTCNICCFGSCLQQICHCSLWVGHPHQRVNLPRTHLGLPPKTLTLCLCSLMRDHNLSCLREHVWLCSPPSGCGGAQQAVVPNLTSPPLTPFFSWPRQSFHDAPGFYESQLPWHKTALFTEAQLSLIYRELLTGNTICVCQEAVCVETSLPTSVLIFRSTFPYWVKEFLPWNVEGL